MTKETYDKEATHRVSKGARLEVTDALFRVQIAADKAAYEKKMRRLRELRLMRDGSLPPAPEKPEEKLNRKAPRRNPARK